MLCNIRVLHTRSPHKKSRIAFTLYSLRVFFNPATRMWSSNMVLVHCARNPQNFTMRHSSLLRVIRISRFEIVHFQCWRSAKMVAVAKNFLHIKLRFVKCRSIKWKYEQARSAALKAVKFLFFNAYICLLNHTLDCFRQDPTVISPSSQTPFSYYATLLVLRFAMSMFKSTL